MGPGFKYHIVSISAIFFALTIGLVVGSVFVSPQVVRRQEIAIFNLQKTFNTDIADKRREIAQYKECVEVISPAALKGKLNNTVVTIIQTGDYPDDAIHAAEAIALANPRSILHILLASRLDRTAEELRTNLADLQSRNPLFPADRDGLFQSIAGLIAHGDSTSSPVFPLYEHEGFVRLTSDDTYSMQAKVAIVVMGSRRADSVRAIRVDAPLIHALLKQGVNVIACEGTGVVASDIPALRSLKGEISTVNNVDTDIGRCALVLAIAAPHGEYGVEPGAEHLLPTGPEL